MDVSVRPATLDDEAEVVAFTQDTWPGRRGDYLPEVFTEWVETDGPTQQTFVAAADGDAVGVVQAVLLSDREAWMHGMRVAPAARGHGVSRQLHEAAADWAHQRGATVGRIMVFSWNGPALAAARAVGFDAGTEFRWAHPAPDDEADPQLSVEADPEAGWRYWQSSPVRDQLRHLVLAPEESWALRELTPETLRWAAREAALAVVSAADQPRGLVFRVRTVDRATADGATERWAEYGVAAWDDGTACETVLSAVARDAAAVGADRTRVVIPETVAAVSDVAVMGTELADEPLFVLEADLTRP